MSANHQEKFQQLADFTQKWQKAWEEANKWEQAIAKLMGGSVAVSPATAPATATPSSTAKARIGRPPGSKNKTKAAKAIVVGGKRGPKLSDDKPVDLPTLLVQIAADAKKPLKLADFVKAANDSGYQSKAADFSNMVYQSLLKLVKKGNLEKNDENRDYRFVKAAA